MAHPNSMRVQKLYKVVKLNQMLKNNKKIIFDLNNLLKYYAKNYEYNGFSNLFFYYKGRLILELSYNFIS